MSGAANCIRRFIARQPAGLLMLLASACMLLAAVSIAWSRNTPRAPGPQTIERKAVGASPADPTAQSPRVALVDLTDCKPINDVGPASAQTPRHASPVTIRRSPRQWYG